jgi:hypothetical protein
MHVALATFGVASDDYNRCAVREVQVGRYRLAHRRQDVGALRYCCGDSAKQKNDTCAQSNGPGHSASRDI